MAGVALPKANKVSLPASRNFTGRVLPSTFPSFVLFTPPAMRAEPQGVRVK